MFPNKRRRTCLPLNAQARTLGDINDPPRQAAPSTPHHHSSCIIHTDYSTVTRPERRVVNIPESNASAELNNISLEEEPEHTGLESFISEDLLDFEVEEGWDNEVLESEDEQDIPAGRSKRQARGVSYHSFFLNLCL
jgi:hypothetical protein